jgi:hypothetical protein
MILVLAVLIVVGSGVPGNEASAQEIDILKKLSGTWLNKDYDEPPGSYPNAKYVIKRDGTYDAYADPLGTSRASFGEFISIDENWIDSEGNFWYKATTVSYPKNLQYYELGKIHSSGNVWEVINLTFDYPNELDTNHGKYRIYYRHE